MSLTRRGFLSAAAVTAGATLAGVRGTTAGANPLGSLGDLATGSLERLDAGSGMLTPRGPLGSVGVTFPSAEQVGGTIRFAFGDGSLGDWLPLTPLDGAPDGGARNAAELVSAPQGATAFEVRAAQGTQAVVLDDGRHGGQNYAGLRRVDFLGVPVVPRSAWGADDNASGGWAPQFFRPQCITIHHTAMACGPDRVGNLRSIFNYHANVLGWGDIGYQLVIDPSGQVYQGHRTHSGYPVFAGPMPPGVRPDSVIGAHVAGTNSGNIGICLMGNFDQGFPTPGAYGALVNVLAKLCNALSLDPFQGVNYWNPDGGWSRPAQAIQGHRDWMSTGCPGNSLHSTLPQVRQAVALAKNSGAMFPTSAGAPSVILPGSTG